MISWLCFVEQTGWWWACLHGFFTSLHRLWANCRWTIDHYMTRRWTVVERGELVLVYCCFGHIGICPGEYGDAPGASSFLFQFHQRISLAYGLLIGSLTQTAVWSIVNLENILVLGWRIPFCLLLQLVSDKWSRLQWCCHQSFPCQSFDQGLLFDIGLLFAAQCFKCRVLGKDEVLRATSVMFIFGGSWLLCR